MPLKVRHSGTLPCVSTILFKVRLPVCFPKQSHFPKGGLLLKERICSLKSKFFFFSEMTPVEVKGSKNKNVRVATLDGVL